MLYSLSVNNYILIGSLETCFPEGLNIISGETGAGKSILLGALSLVLGAKADASMVGPAGENCIVEAEFGVDDAIRDILTQADLPCDDDRLVLRRTVARSGRSRSFANDEPVSVNVLQELSERLVDIHSQHQTLRLQDARFRMEALDLRAGCVELRNDCAQAWNQVLTLRRELSDLEQRLQSARDQQEYNQSRWQRLEEAKLVSGELEELEAEQKQLAHAEEIKETLSEADALLSPSSDELPSPTRQMRECAKLLEKAARYVPAMEGLSERLTSARLELEDIAAEVATAAARIDVSPQRLEQVEDRLSLLYGLFQKYGATSVEELMAERDRLGSLVMDATSLCEDVETARKALEEASKRHTALCDQLHAKRLSGAAPFAAAVEELLHGLDLEKARFQVLLEDAAPGATGRDAVQFRFGANGTALTDVAKAASGGELSRIMLSIKAEMARFQHMPTLVFDEIDSGVSGGTADKMGRLVCEMGRSMQVFAITHLPQVAAKGHAHFLVSKASGSTTVHQLDNEGRVQELARMLSGATITPEAVANARALLNS
ncbi:MAG: DNA repair protein RecN [Bacteroidales bacterium]|nr:DNA repair protein RecN [Bacteroidales bacterium]